MPDVLHPLEGPKKDSLTAQSEELTGCLNNIHQMGEDMSFNDLLTQLEMDYETYEKIIQLTLVRPKVILKRSINECRVNNYNTVLLKCWKTNMSLTHTHVCHIIVAYIAKGQRGLSNLLQQAREEAKERASDIGQQVRRSGNLLLSSVDVGAQEAVYIVLQLPL